MTLIPLNFAEFQAGSINPSGVYDSNSNLNIGAKASPFIPVKTGVTYTIKIQYDLNKLTGHTSPWAFGRMYSYDSNFEPIAAIGSYNESVSFKIQEIATRISGNVKYIRFVASHIAQDAVNITLNSDEIEDEIEDGKTILKLYANGNFETIDASIKQGSPIYSFAKDAINVPSIIKIPPTRNYFIEKTSVQGHLNSNSGLVQGGLEYDLTSDFIAVTTGEQLAIRATYTGIDRARPWITSCYYNANKELVSLQINGHVLYAGAVDGVYTNTFIVPDNVAYLRLSTNLFFHPTTIVTVSIEKAAVASSTHYPALEDLNLPEWVRDTGNPISVFTEGIVIKGELISPDIEPEPEPEPPIDPPEPPENDIIFADDFNRPDSDSLGENWINGRGSWGIENNMVRPINSNSIALCVHPHGDNVSISADVKRVRSDGIVFRAKDAANHLYVHLENADLKLKSLVNGIVTTLKTFNLNSVYNQIYRLRVELRGAEIKVYVDDVLCITHETSAFLNDNLSGFQSWSQDGTNGRFDNFEIRNLVVAPPPQGEVLFSDDFNRPNANTLGEPWITTEGYFHIKDGWATPTGTYSQSNKAVVNAGESDNVCVAVTIKPFKFEALMLRAVDVNNCVEVICERGWLNIRSKRDGTSTTHAFVDISELFTETFNLKVELRGQKVTALVDDVVVLTASHENLLFDGTYYGLYSWSDSGILGSIGQYDNFEIRNLPTPVLFKDDFNRADSSTLGGRWEVTEGSYAIENNVAVATNTYSVNNTAVVDVGESDNLSITCMVSAYVSESIIIKYVDNNNYVHVLNENELIYIRMKKNGVTSTLRTSGVSIPTLTLYKITIELRGQEIKIFINDELKITHTSSEFLDATKVGIKSWSNSGDGGVSGYFDDFEINRLTD